MSDGRGEELECEFPECAGKVAEVVVAGGFVGGGLVEKRQQLCDGSQALVGCELVEGLADDVDLAVEDAELERVHAELFLAPPVEGAHVVGDVGVFKDDGGVDEGLARDDVGRDDDEGRAEEVVGGKPAEREGRGCQDGCEGERVV